MPYSTMQLLGPCPYMSHGWIARDKKGQLLHVRTALEPSPVADHGFAGGALNLAPYCGETSTTST